MNISEEERELLTLFRALDWRGRDMVLFTAREYVKCLQEGGANDDSGNNKRIAV